MIHIHATKKLYAKLPINAEGVLVSTLKGYQPQPALTSDNPLSGCQRFGCFKAGAVTPFDTLNRLHTYPDQFSQMFLRPTSLQSQFSYQHLSFSVL